MEGAHEPKGPKEDRHGKQAKEGSCRWRLGQLGHPAADFGLVLRVLRAAESFHIESGPVGFAF